MSIRSVSNSTRNRFLDDRGDWGIHRLAATIAAAAGILTATVAFVAAAAAAMPVESQPVTQMKVTIAEQATEEAFLLAGITG